MLKRESAPDLAPLSVPAFLPHRRIALENGIEVVYIHDPAQEVFKIDITFEAGVYYQAQPLVASTAVNMLNEGTDQHTAETIADLFDYYGAYVDFNCGLNKSEFSMIALNKYAVPTIGMMAEMMAESVIPEEELEIYLTNKRQEFLVNNEKTDYLARKKFSGLLFGEEHPYANQLTEADYTTITTGMIRDFYHRHINANQCKIIVCGNVSEEILQLISKQFTRLKHPAVVPESIVRPFRPAPAGRYHITKESAVQCSIRIGKSGVRLTDKDYAGFMLLNTILGGYFGSRLMSNIREEKGYTYGIHSFNVSMPQGSYWCISADVNSRHSEAAIEEILKEIHRLQTEKVPVEELDLVKNYLHGDLLRELDGVFAQADALKHKLNYGLDNQIYTGIIEQIRQCGPDELLVLANKYWQQDELYIITAGKTTP